MTRVLERRAYKYSEAEAVLIEIRRQIRLMQFEEAMYLCEHLKSMIQARQAWEAMKRDE